MFAKGKKFSDIIFFQILIIVKSCEIGLILLRINYVITEQIQLIKNEIVLF